MYIKASELRQLDVINIEDGKHLGNVCDVDVDPDNGLLKAIILDKPGGFLRFFRQDDMEISWHDVILIGIDVILVKVRTDYQGRHKSW